MDRKIKPPDKERKLNDRLKEKDMLAKSCQWWLIWYLLFFCHGGAEGQLQWVVKEKVTAYGQNLTLFCPVENCCREPAGWFVGDKTIIIDVKAFSNDPSVKYHGTYNTDGFGVVIRNLSEADLNVTYHCVYGFSQSTSKYLLHGDVFKENVPDKDKEIDIAAIVVPIVVIMVVIGFIIGIVYYVYKSRKKRQKQTGTDEEMKNLNPSDSQMKNQQELKLCLHCCGPPPCCSTCGIKKKRQKQTGKGKERENFFRISILVVDHIKNALVHMFKHYLRQKKMSFEKFIDEHIEDIRYLKRSKILYKDEVDKLIVGVKAISGITVDNLELMLERLLLDNLCPDLFMDDGCQTLQDFLKKNQHDIYHLFKYDQRCCQCNDHYTVPVREQLLKENEYKNMFESSPCTSCTGAVCSGFTCKNTEYIRLDYRTRCTVFEHFSRIFKAVQNLKNLRDDTYGHIEAGEIPDDDYDGYYNAIEASIMVLARFCGNENETRLALDDVQTRSLDETLCKQYMISLLEEIKRDIELMEVIGENSQKLQESIQKIEKQLQKLTEQMGNMNLNKGIQILMNQTNNIERNSLERDHSQQVAVVGSSGLMRNSEPQNLHSSVNPTDDQAGALTSCSPESSSNNISTGNDQRGQGYQSSIGTDAEPYISSVNNERAHDREKKRDGVVLHVEEDRVAAEEFIKNMERENPDLDIGIISYDNLPAGTSQLKSAANVFHNYSYFFIFETENFTESKFEMYISEIALVETLKKSGKQERLIPVAVERDRTCDHPILAPLIPLKYYHYLEAKKSQQESYQDFIRCFRYLITNGRKKYLVS